MSLLRKLDKTSLTYSSITTLNKERVDLQRHTVGPPSIVSRDLARPPRVPCGGIQQLLGES